MVTHIVMIIDGTPDPMPVTQHGYNLEDVQQRVTEALAPGSGNVFEGMNAVIDPFPYVSH